jgi:hypothetical protein
MSNVTTVQLSNAELALILARRNGTGNAVAEVEQPTPPSSAIRKGDLVLYTGKTSGKTKEYLVKWAGLDRDGVTPRLGLPMYGKAGKLFFVNADAVRRS